MLNLKQNYAKIYDSFDNLKSETIKKLFAEFYLNVKKYLKT